MGSFASCRRCRCIKHSEAIEKMLSCSYRVIVLDLGLPPDENGASEGLKALDEILSAAPLT